jgi:hypothetical protein
VDPAWFEKVLYPLQHEVTALLDREEPKDLADIWGLCRLGGLGLRDALVGASSKAVGPPPPPAGDFLRDLRALGEDLLLVR